MTSRMQWAMRIVAVLFGFALAGSAVGQGTLWGATGANGTTSNLYTINPATGAATVVGPIGFAVTGLAVHPSTGVLYGSTTNNSTNSPGSLITINKSTGQGTLVGGYGFSGQSMADLTFTSDGTLYGWLEANSDDLYTVNLSTGAATKVGESGLNTFGSGLAANASNVLFYAGDGNRGTFWNINRATGLPTVIVAAMSGGTSPDDSPISALAFSPAGTLYGVILDFNLAARPSKLVTINPATGVITDVGNSVDKLDAIAFDGATVGPPLSSLPVPATSPAVLALMALLLAAGAWIALRRRA